MAKSRLNDSARKVSNVNRAIISNHAIKRSITNSEVSGIIQELERAGVIKDKENLNFKINNNELIVNGAKQSGPLHEQLKQKYLRNAGDYINYTRNGNTTSTTINRE